MVLTLLRLSPVKQLLLAHSIFCNRYVVEAERHCFFGYGGYSESNRRFAVKEKPL